MRYLLLVLILSGCVVKGHGTFTGKLTDVNWGGIFFPSCEIRQQNTLVFDRSSSFSKDLCENLSKKTGQEITIEYDEHLFCPWRLGTGDVITGVR